MKRWMIALLVCGLAAAGFAGELEDAIMHAEKWIAQKYPAE